MKTLVDPNLTMFLNLDALLPNVNLSSLQLSHQLNLWQLLDLFFVNLSMESGILSTNMKVASVNALLQEFKNFKPISNESFLFH